MVPGSRRGITPWKEGNPDFPLLGRRSLGLLFCLRRTKLTVWEFGVERGFSIGLPVRTLVIWRVRGFSINRADCKDLSYRASDLTRGGGFSLRLAVKIHPICAKSSRSKKYMSVQKHIHCSHLPASFSPMLPSMRSICVHQPLPLSGKRQHRCLQCHWRPEMGADIIYIYIYDPGACASSVVWR